MAKVTVAILGARDESGQSIVNGLLNDPDADFEITALIQPQSLQKPFNVKLQERGVRVVAADLNGPQEALVNLLSGIDIVISAIFFGSLADERPLAEALKKAGVKRFFQSAFIIVIPSRGVVDFREQKEDNLNFIQKLRLPYTYVDAVGTLSTSQLFYSWAIRGDSTPEYAQYLVYLDGKELYPHFEFIKFED